MGIKRVVDTSFWTDGKVDDFSPEDKYFMLYLLTNPFTTQLGIYEMPPKQAAFQLGYSMEAVSVLLDRFETKYGVLRYSKDTHEVAIKNYLRHSIIKGGKPVEDCLVKELKAVKNKNLISWVFSNVKKHENLNDTVKKIILDYEKENEIDNENENENDNDDTLAYRERIVDVSSTKRKKPVKHKYGEYKNVLLSDEELEKLKTEFPDWEERIERVSSYMASTGKTYKNFLATIRNWAKKDNEKPKVQQKKNAFHNFEQRSYDYDALQRMAAKSPRTAADDESIRLKAENLRKELGGV